MKQILRSAYPTDGAPHPVAAAVECANVQKVARENLAMIFPRRGLLDRWYAMTAVSVSWKYGVCVCV